MTLACTIYKSRITRLLTRRQRNRCYICHELMGDPRKLPPWADRFPTLDHVIPQSRGGTDEIDNLRMSCRRCNLAKGDRLPDGLTWRGPAAGDGLRGGLEVITR